MTYDAPMTDQEREVLVQAARALLVRTHAAMPKGPFAVCRACGAGPNDYESGISNPHDAHAFALQALRILGDSLT